MPKANNKKICIVVSSLGKGGAERSSGLLSQMLYDGGFDVHIVSVLNNIEFPYKGKLLNLGELKDKDNSVFGRLNRALVLKKYLRNHNFDYVIDNRSRIGFLKEFIISKLIYTPKNTIYCVRSYNINQYINPNKLYAKLIYGNAYKIVTVSKAIAERVEEVYSFKNVMSIYNAVAFKETISKHDAEDQYILFFGRIDDDIKNISLLLEGYSKSKLLSQHVKLKILGDGKDVDMLKERVRVLNLSSNVEFLGHNPYPFAIVKSALFTVLTSRYEGFPRSIIESLALEIPVVSVDCKSGPNEIIKHKYNGLLIENNNPEALTEAINLLFEDKDLYLHCKRNSKSSITHFSEANIVKQWQTLLN